MLNQNNPQAQWAQMLRGPLTPAQLQEWNQWILEQSFPIPTDLKHAWDLHQSNPSFRTEEESKAWRNHINSHLHRLVDEHCAEVYKEMRMQFPCCPVQTPAGWINPKVQSPQRLI